MRTYQNIIENFANMKVIMVLCIDEAGILAEVRIILSYRLYSLSYTLSYTHFGDAGNV